jgi:hypothetical protein
MPSRPALIRSRATGIYEVAVEPSRRLPGRSSHRLGHRPAAEHRGFSVSYENENPSQLVVAHLASANHCSTLCS